MRPYFKCHRTLTSTNNQSLPRRLAQISRIRAGEQHSPVLRVMLAFVAIRNEGTHLGLLQFDHPKIIELIGVTTHPHFRHNISIGIVEHGGGVAFECDLDGCHGLEIA